jgi:hypothetical protein
MAFCHALQLREVLDGADHLGGVGVLVVVPRNNLDLEETVANFGNHGLGGIEEGAISHTDDVGGDDWFFVVAEGSGDLGLHGSVDLLNGDIFAFDNGDEDGGRTSWDWNTLSGTDELAIEFWDDKTDGLGSASAIWDDVGSASTGTA